MLWVNGVAHLLSVHRMMTVEVGDGLKKELGPDSYDQLMYTQNAETIALLLLCCASEGRKGLPGRMH